MRTRILSLALCLILVGTAPFVSGSPSNTDTELTKSSQISSNYGPTISNFLDLVASGEPEKATEALVNDDDSLEEMRKSNGYAPLIESLRSLAASCGKYRGYELSSTKELTSRFHRVYVFAHFDKRAILFVFDMYKPNDKWQSRAFSFKSEYEDYIQTFPAQEAKRGN